MHENDLVTNDMLHSETMDNHRNIKEVAAPLHAQLFGTILANSYFLSHNSNVFIVKHNLNRHAQNLSRMTMLILTKKCKVLLSECLKSDLLESPKST